MCIKAVTQYLGQSNTPLIIIHLPKRRRSRDNVFIWHIFLLCNYLERISTFAFCHVFSHGKHNSGLCVWNQTEHKEKTAVCLLFAKCSSLQDSALQGRISLWVALYATGLSHVREKWSRTVLSSVSLRETCTYSKVLFAWDKTQKTKNIIYIYLIINEWQSFYTTTRGSLCLWKCTYTGSVHVPPGQSGQSLECGITFPSYQSDGSEDGSKRISNNKTVYQLNLILFHTLTDWISPVQSSHWFPSLAAAISQSELI